MDTDGLRRGLTISFRTVVAREWRLFAGMGVGLVGYLLWIGATGAALSEIASFAGINTDVEQWTSGTTQLAIVGLVLWVLLPAIAAVWLVRREVTNLRNNLANYYRIHPFLLLVPPVVLLAVGGLGVAVDGGESRPALALVVLAAVFFQIRTLTYSYRVFAGSIPQIQQASLLITSIVVLLTVLVEGATALGRDQFVTDAAAGFGEAIGTSAVSDLVGTSTVLDSTVPTLLGLAIATPVVLGGGYVCIQAIVGVVVRVRGNEVLRSQLRTGQRYPEFARPTTSPRARSTGTKSSSQKNSTDTTSSSTANSGDVSTQSGDTNEVDETEEVTHTRVFTPDTVDDQTEVVGDEETDDSCPYCEADLGDSVGSCPNCGATL